MGKNKDAMTNINPSSVGRGKTVLIIIIVAIVLALVLVIARIAANKKDIATQPENTIPSTKVITGYAEPVSFEKGKGLWIKGGKLLSNKEITAEAKAGTKVFEYYYDYTCNICNDYDEFLGSQIESLAENNKAVVVLRPTLTHNLPFAHVANNLLLWTAQNQPHKTWELQKSLASYAIKTYKTADYDANKNNETWRNEAENPLPVVEKIAAENGIDFAQVPPAPVDAGSVSIQNFAFFRATALGGDPDHVGTPMYLANGEMLDIRKAKNDPKFLEKAVL